MSNDWAWARNWYCTRCLEKMNYLQGFGHRCPPFTWVRVLMRWIRKVTAP